MSDIQHHNLKSGRTIEITRKRSGRGHRYILNGEGKGVKSMTSILDHLEVGSFGIGVNWALKQARLAGNDLDAPKRIGDQAREEGELLHAQIEDYINTGSIAESLPFLSWHELISTWQFQGLDLIATERFVYDDALKIGGTVDAIAQVDGEILILDWKTKVSDSFYRFGPSIKDQVQRAGYTHALRNMNSIFAPSKAALVYVMRDGGKAVRVDVDLEKYIPIYKATHKLHSLLEVK